MNAPDTQALEPSDAPEGSEATPVSPDPGNAPQPVCVPDWPPCPDLGRRARIQAEMPEHERVYETTAEGDDETCPPPRDPLPRPGPALLAEAARARAEGRGLAKRGRPPIKTPDQEAEQLDTLRRRLARSGYAVHQVRAGYMAFCFGSRTIFADLEALQSWVVREGLL